MIICKACSYKNPDSASFCESCGSFLEWTGEKVSVEAPSGAETDDVVEPDDAEVGSRLAASYVAAQKGSALKVSPPVAEHAALDTFEPQASSAPTVEAVPEPPTVVGKTSITDSAPEAQVEPEAVSAPVLLDSAKAEPAEETVVEPTGESAEEPSAAPIAAVAEVAAVESLSALASDPAPGPAVGSVEDVAAEPAALLTTEPAVENPPEAVKHSLRRSRIFGSDHAAATLTNVPSAPLGEPAQSVADVPISPLAADDGEAVVSDAAPLEAATVTQAPEAAKVESASPPEAGPAVSDDIPVPDVPVVSSATKPVAPFGGGMRPGLRGGLSAKADLPKRDVDPPVASTAPETPATDAVAAAAVAGPDLFDALDTEPTEPAIGQRPSAISPSALKPQMSRRRAARSETAHLTAVREERIDESAPSISCPNCSTGNDPARYFCHHCAQILPPPPPPPPPLTRWERVKLWFVKKYRKIFYTKPAEAPAGERVGKMWRSAGVDSSNETVKGRLVGVARKSAMAVGGLAVLFAFLGPFRPQFNNAFSRVRSDILSRIELRYNAVFPVSATASSYLPALPPTNAIDGLSNTYWAAQPSANNGVGQTLTVRFSPSTRLDKIGFIIGADDNPANYTAQPRPDKVKVTFSSGKSQVFTLVDSSAFQSFTIHHLNVASVTVTVESVYKSPVGHSVAIAEVLFYQLV